MKKFKNSIVYRSAIGGMYCILCVLPFGIAVDVALAEEVGSDQTSAIHVVRDDGCGCCEAWIEYLQKKGFKVTMEKRRWFELAAYKTAKGVPNDAISCHTATIDRYVVEGHVPADDIRLLLSKRPNAIGLSVPGMPYGSPGMGPESEREAYDVMLIKPDGELERFTSYSAN